MRIGGTTVDVDDPQAEKVAPSSEEDRQLAAVLARLGGGENEAMTDLVQLCHERLLRAVRLRIDPRLRAKIETEDVLQDFYIEVKRRAPGYDPSGDMPPFVWLRFLALQALQKQHRHFLGTEMRDVGQEVSLHHGSLPQASSASLAEVLLGRARCRPGCKPLTTPSEAAVRAEAQARVQEALNRMNAIDREVLTMRSFEGLSNAEIALSLGLSPKAANHRFTRAKERLGEILSKTGL
jgi:RNA polymerase sigma-70 factor (ECF subfamily)